jgi:sulfate adenylyltransferase large subunit
MRTVVRTAIQADLEIEALLAQDQAKDLLRFTTAGSVDDGKSTLIGRLLYDSKNVFEDHIRSVAKASLNRGNGSLDLSLLTDGLRAEREQGITIDVAYRYFTTSKRKFIIADTPGHEQYTRNMATGASTAELAIILIDARNGVLPQSRRHAFIASLLGIPNLVVAINKMDAVRYDEGVFRWIESEFGRFLDDLQVPAAYFLPISALVGDNVVTRSGNMPWFKGQSLLEHLETVEVASTTPDTEFRFPVQYVIRPNQDFRGYAGQIGSGYVRPGDEVLVLPAGRKTRVKSIASFDGDLEVAHAPMSVTLTLEDNIDISRGDMLACPLQKPRVSRQFEAHVVWMSESGLDPGNPLLLKHTTQMVAAEVKALVHRVNIRTLEAEPATTLALNEIGVLRIAASKPLYFDPYRENRATGCFSLIDPVTNATVGAGMIIREIAEQRRRVVERSATLTPVAPAERNLRWGHTGAVVSYGDRPQLGVTLERELFERGAVVVRLTREPSDAEREQATSAGLLLLVPGAADIALPSDDQDAANELIEQLALSGVLMSDELTGGKGI